MKTSSLMKSLFLVIFTFLFLSVTFAQDNHKDGCCSKKESKMDQSMSENKDSVQTSELNAVEVDSKLEAWNKVCPVTGESINPEANKVSYNDKIYGFCCNGCDEKFLKDPEKYSKNLSDDGKNYLGTTK